MSSVRFIAEKKLVPLGIAGSAQSHPERSDVVARSGAKLKCPAGALQSRHDGLELGLAQGSRAQDEGRRLPHVVVNKPQTPAIRPPTQNRIDLLHFHIP